jgi:hypothetical protein
MLRIGRKRRADPANEAERHTAEVALTSARQSITDARRLGAETRAVSAALNSQVRRNHFAPLVAAAIRKRHP